ncbi:MAG: sugar transferase [Chthoniobacterales bacterium]|nr:sugar transferase [Chthoniobacterales bacterium]
MSNEEISTTPRPVFRFRDTVAIKIGEAHPAREPAPPPAAATQPAPKRGLIARASDQEWSASALVLFLDIAAWLLIYGVTSLLRGDAYYSSSFVFFVIDLLQVTVIVISLFTIGGYDRNTETRSLAYATEHLLAIVTAAVVSSALIYSAATFDQTMKPSRGVLLLSFIIFAPVSLQYRRWLRWRIAATLAERTFLVIGTGELAQKFYEAYVRSSDTHRLEFVDAVGERVGETIAGPDSPVIEGDVATKLRRGGTHYSGVILADRVEQIPTELLERLVRTQFQRSRVYTLESFYESHWRYVPLDAIDPVWPLQTGFQLARSSPYHYLKRLCDLLASLALMVVLAPVFLMAALFVLLGSGRPIFYHQERVGRGGKPFIVTKFRTMVNRPAQTLDDIYTRPGDPRITRVGRWLRKLRLDELPQLWSVFRGEMSLIGPRAEWTKCAERYETFIPFYHFRHLVKPGITGWAQVNYPYGESEQDAIEKLKYDLYYIRRYSLKLDAMIALKTVHVMLFGKGQ